MEASDYGNTNINSLLQGDRFSAFESSENFEKAGFSKQEWNDDTESLEDLEEESEDSDDDDFDVDAKDSLGDDDNALLSAMAMAGRDGEEE
jgi:DNA-directed RNA polymerase subunit beta